MPVACFDYDSELKCIFTHLKIIRALVQSLPTQLDDVKVKDLQLKATEQ